MLLEEAQRHNLCYLLTTQALNKHLLQKHNTDYPEDLFDTVEDLLEQLSDFHIDEIIPVKQLNTNSPWDQVVILHHFNGQLLYSKVYKVEESLYQKIV